MNAIPYKQLLDCVLYKINPDFEVVSEYRCVLRIVVRRAGCFTYTNIEGAYPSNNTIVSLDEGGFEFD